MTVSEISELVDLMLAKDVLELRTGDVSIRLSESRPAGAMTPLVSVPEEPEPDLTLWSSPFDPSLGKKGA
jgi:hypothetical protein